MAYKVEKFGSTIKRRNYQKTENDLKVFDLLKIQKDSFDDFIKNGIKEIFEEIYPVISTNKKLRVEYIGHHLEIPKNSEELIRECKSKGSNFFASLKAKFKLIDNIEGITISEDEAFIANIPLMTKGGSFIINGSERVIISQIIRSPGSYFENLKSARVQSSADSSVLKILTLIPNRGAWIEFDYKDYVLLEQDPSDIKLRIDRSKRVKTALLFHSLGLNQKEVLDLYGNHELIVATLQKIKKDDQMPFSARTTIFKILNPGERPSTKSVNDVFSNLLFNQKRYDLSKTGRYKINKKISPRNRLLGQFLAEDVKSTNGKIIFEQGTEMNHKNVDVIMNHWEKNTLEFTDIDFDQEVFSAFKELSHTELQKFAQLHIIKVFGKNDQGKIDKNKIINIISVPKTDYLHLTVADLLANIGYFINLEQGLLAYDDIDSLENRKIKTIKELLNNQIRIGLTRIEKNKKDRLSSKDQSLVTIKNITNHKLMESTLKEFFNSSQLSQFMDQVNPLAELSNKRRITSLGPGGLSRDTASLVVRGIHDTHYGRIDPIETPEGPNIGLILNLAIYARVNEYGLIETPYFVVENKKINRKKVIYLTSDLELDHTIAPSNIGIKNDQIIDKEIIARKNNEFVTVKSSEVSLIDVSPKQTVSLATAHIPFLEHDDANRALMGANMQRQSIPLLKSDSPIVATGIEESSAKYSPTTITAEEDGTVTEVTSKHIIVNGKNKKVYILDKFVRSNQGSAINQRPIVKEGQKVKAEEVIADGPSVDQGELAIGKNPLVAFTTWRGYNYEDAIIISEKLVKDDTYTSIHIEEHRIEQKTTRLGKEEITPDISNTSKESMRNLDSRGIIVEGSEVRVGDILVGKISPKGEEDISSEEMLLNAILGSKVKSKKDSSLRVPYGAEGVVQKVEILKKSKNIKLDDGVEQIIKVYIAQKRKIKEGDKMSGRHGNKGVISKVLPEEDMPHLDDGTPVDIMLNPLGVPSRMNVGQVLELHLGMAAKTLGIKVVSPIFSGANIEEIQDILKEAGHDQTGKFTLTDGITGQKYNDKVAVGVMYMLKLSHMIDDKMHARSIGPYSLITQQPLRGKSQNGGQRFGEMEAWAIEAYGASELLREMVTLKSDDIKGRNELYNAITKGRRIPHPNIPEGFWVLFYEMRGLGLSLNFLNKDNEVIEIDNKL